jgi:hypothetical protein
MNNPSDHIPGSPDTGSGFISRSDDVPDPFGGPPAGDTDWFILHAFDDGSSFIEGLDGGSGR